MPGHRVGAGDPGLVPPARARWTREAVLSALTGAAISCLGIAAAILLWYLTSWSIGRYFPTPIAVFQNAAANLTESRYLQGLGLPPGGYLPHLLYTVRNVAVGVAIGVMIGVATGFGAFRWAVIEAIVDPITTIFGTLPILVAAPFFLIWFGLVAATQIILVAFYTTMVMHLFVLRSARNVDLKYIENARTLGATEPEIFRRVVLPGALPEIFGGVRVAFGSAWGLAAIAELLGAQYGVGRVIVSLAAVYDVAGMMALIVLLGLIALALDSALVVIRTYLTRWSATTWSA